MNVRNLNRDGFVIDPPNARPAQLIHHMSFKIFTCLAIAFCPFFCSKQVFSQTSNFVEANGIKTHYLEWGKGKNTIVLIHGLSDTAEVWQELAVILAKTHRVIAPDRRGSGKSEKPSNNYDSQTLAVDVEKLLDALKIKRAALVGHSFGGNTALTFAANAPGRIESLVLIEGGFWEKREPAPLPECSVPVSGDCLISTIIQRGINEYDAEKLYSKVRAPSLLILGLPGELNKSVLNENEKQNRRFFDEAVSHVNNIAANKLKRSKALVIKDAQHWVFRDQPKITAEAIEKFIKEN